MNLATKTMPWMVASLLAVTTVFGQSQNQNQGSCTPQPPVCKPAKCCNPQVPQPPMNCAYNAPGEINVGCQGDIDFFASGSFLYWQPILENMTVGFVNNNNPFVAAGSREVTINGSYVEMNFKYKPGFKVGLGMNLQTDDWDGYAEYTRVHGEHNVNSNGAGAIPSILPTFGNPFLFATSGSTSVFNTVSSYYNNNLDFVDAEMGRTYYVGKWLMFRPAWGARGSWITQNVHVRYNNTFPTILTDPAGFLNSQSSVVNVYQRQRSWGVGPRTGLMMDWMLGKGVRFFGSGYGDILYHKFKVQDKTVYMSRVTNGTNFLVGNPTSVITYDTVGTVRTHLDFEAGFGWGSYFDNNNWHIDLSASYGWQVFFNHNMFRQFETGGVPAKSILPNGNLYVQGLTVTARVDF